MVNGSLEFHYEQLLNNILYFLKKNTTNRVNLQNLKCLLQWAKPRISAFVSIDVAVSICVRVAKVMNLFKVMNQFLLELDHYCKKYNYKWLSCEIQDIEESVKSRYLLFRRELEGTEYQYRGIFDSISMTTWISEPVIRIDKMLPFHREMTKSKMGLTLYQISHKLRSLVESDDIPFYIKTTHVIPSETHQVLAHILHKIIAQERTYTSVNIEVMNNRIDRCIVKTQKAIDNLETKQDSIRVQIPLCRFTDFFRKKLFYIKKM